LNAPAVLAEKVYKVDYSRLHLIRGRFFNIYKGNQLVYENLNIDLLGFYQQKNICTVLTAVDQLQTIGFSVPQEAIYYALDKVTKITGLQGRWQTIGYNR